MRPLEERCPCSQVVHVQMYSGETAGLIKCINDVPAMDALSVSISQGNVKIGQAYLNLQRWMNT